MGVGALWCAFSSCPLACPPLPHRHFPPTTPAPPPSPHSPTVTHPPYPSTVLAHPSVYVTGREYGDLNVRNMAKWGATAVIHAGFTFWIPYGTYAVWDTLWDGASGLTMGFASAGLSTFLCLVWGMQLTACFITLTWTKWHVIILAISQLFFYIFLVAYQSLYIDPDFWAVLNMTWQNAVSWLSIVLVLGTMALWDVSLEFIRSQVAPSYTDVLREVEAGIGDPAASAHEFEAVSKPRRLRSASKGGPFSAPAVLDTAPRVRHGAGTGAGSVVMHAATAAAATITPASPLYSAQPLNARATVPAPGSVAIPSAQRLRQQKLQGVGVGP